MDLQTNLSFRENSENNFRHITTIQPNLICNLPISINSYSQLNNNLSIGRNKVADVI